MHSAARARPWLGVAACGVIAAAAGAQANEPTDKAAAKAALERWVGSDLADAGVLQRAVDAILAAKQAGMEVLGAAAAAARQGDDPNRRQALDAAVTHVVIAVLQREAHSGMVYEGQYAVLKPLQPAAGLLLLRLLLDTPDWYHGGERHLLVAPIRDLYPQAPDSDSLQAVREVAGDEDFEPAPLRQALAFLLAQWGDRTLIDRRLAAIAAELGQDDLGADRRAALRYEIADIHFTLREYERAGAIHVEMLRAAEKAAAHLVPVNYYNAACALARAGAVAAALDELERGVALIEQGVDPSQRLEAKLFDEDPDLAPLRADPRFRQLRRRAFPDHDGQNDADRGR